MILQIRMVLALKKKKKKKKVRKKKKKTQAQLKTQKLKLNKRCDAAHFVKLSNLKISFNLICSRNVHCYSSELKIILSCKGTENKKEMTWQMQLCFVADYRNVMREQAFLIW